MKFYKQIMIDIYAYSIVLSLTILFRQSFVSVAVQCPLYRREREKVFGLNTL